MNASTPNTKLAIEQARTIRAAQANGRALSAWSVLLSSGRIAVVYAVTDRAAGTVASADGTSVVRVGPAAVRNMDAALARALAAVPSPGRSPRETTVPAVSRDAARDYYVAGIGARPALPSTVVRRTIGEPRKALTARCRPGQYEPCVSEYTLTGGRTVVRLAHEAPRSYSRAS